MYVFVVFKCLYHILISADGGHYAQLYLRIVSRDKAVALALADERLPYLPSPLCADGYILQVRVIAAQPAGNRHRLVE